MGKKLCSREILVDERRTRRCVVKWSREEFGVLEQLAMYVHKSRSEVIRQLVLSNARCMLVDIPTALNTLDRIGVQQAPIATDIKEIARMFHRLEAEKIVDPQLGSLVTSVLSEHVRLQKSLHTAIRKLIRLIGGRR
ncbi:hypothetical protein [Sphingobacterium suaedae]|uniref:Ribbon-helix-helix protein, CopG family n=1 Tax=Sphingobacterium suaedae TaxID=1686402 RepID=A0ABW5KLM2_9SPHI